MNEQKHEEALKEQIREYRKLQNIADSEAFKDFFDYLIKTVTDKVVWGFGTKVDKETKKVSDNIDNWDEFCKWRGEIIARLQPIQAIMGSDAMVQYLQQTLDEYYKQQA